MEKLKSKIYRWLLWTALAAAAVGAPDRLLATSPAEQALLAKAQALAAHGHLNLAVQTWQQALLSDPQNKEALAGIARAEMRLGKPKEAQRYLDRLRALGADAAAIGHIASMSDVQPPAVRLEEASRLAQSGKYTEAMRIYHDIYGDEPPAGNSALMYYDTEAAIPSERQHAVEGLRNLARRFPADSRYAITLGRVLTYDPKTREEGIAILRQYPSVAIAQGSIKQAEAWNEVARSAGPAAGAREHEGNPLEAAAYRALNRGHLSEAQQRFQELLSKEPNNTSALSGMGYLLMKEQNFTAAKDYLERARSAGAKNLENSITLTQFWLRMAEGDTQLKNGNSDAAINDYRAATSMEPSRPEAMEALAGALMQKGSYADAADLFKHALHIAPDRTTSWRGLFLAESETDDAQSALATIENMPADIRAQMDTDPGYLRARAQDDLALGLRSDYDHVVKLALALPFPNQGRDMPPDRKMQYAALLTSVQRYEPAMQLYRQVIAGNSENIDAWRALVALQHQLHRDNEALAAIGRMPPDVFNQLDNDTRFLTIVGSIYQSEHEQARAREYLERAVSAPNAQEPSTELQLADVYAAMGEQQKAYAIYLREAEDYPQDSAAWRGLIGILHQLGHDREALSALASMPESTRLRLESDAGYLQILASIQVATGQNQNALRTFDQIAAVYAEENEVEPLDVKIQDGWALLNAGEYGKLYTLVSAIANTTDMTKQQQAGFNQLLAEWSVHRANAASASGNQRSSITILEAAAKAIPGNSDVLNSLAGAYLKAGEAKRAVAIYKSLNMDGANLGQYEGAIGAALAAGDKKHAAAWIESALNRFKGNAKILQMAAQYEQVIGNSQRAISYYRAALAALGPESQAEMFSSSGGTDGTLGGPQNPNSPGRDLMNLLAPNGRAGQNSDSMTTTGHPWVANQSWQVARPKSVQTLGDFAQPGGYDQSALTNAGNNISDSKPDRLADARPDKDILMASQKQNQTVSAGKHSYPFDNFKCCHNADASPRIPPPGFSGSSPSTKESTAAFIRGISAGDANAADLPQRMPSDDQVTIAGNKFSPMPMRDLPTTQAVRQVAAPLPQGTTQDSPPPVPPVDETAIQSSGPLPNIESNSDASRNAALQATQNQPHEPNLPPLTGPAKPFHQAETQREQIDQQLALLEGASSSWLGGASSIASRSGQPGYDRLAMYSIPVEASTMLGSIARLTLITVPMLLDSGAATGTETLRQGTLPASSVPTQQSAAGIGGELQLRTSQFAASLGYTPQGFLVGNVTGGIYVHPAAGHFTFTFLRSPIFDSQLAYAGLRDEGSAGPAYLGNVWGGVIANSGEIEVASADSRSGWYLQGGGQYISGVHVPTNSRFDGDFGAYWGSWHQPEYGNLTVGMNFFGMHYSQNLRYFTYGQGGYFSPEAYVVAGLPVTFTGHYQEKLHYHVGAALGVQAFKEDSSLYFPLDPAIQTANGNLSYPAATNIGGNYNFDGEASYAISDHWYAGGFMNFNNSRDYAFSNIGFYIRYLFEDVTSVVES